MFRQLVLGFILFNSFFGEISAQEERSLISGFSHQAENDVFVFIPGKNLDKDYTGSFKFEFYTDYLKNGIFPLFRNQREYTQNYNSVYIHGMGFTPDRSSFHLETVDSTQRPYSSLVAIGRRRIAEFTNNNCAPEIIVSDLYVGVIGLRQPGNLQNFIHRNISNSDLVKGWKNQIGDGGRFAISYLVKASFRLGNYSDFSGSRLCRLFKNFGNHSYLSPHATFGNVIVNGGVKYSFSNVTPNLFNASAPIRSNQKFRYYKESSGSSNEKYGKGKDVSDQFVVQDKGFFGYEFYAQPNIVLRNSFLQGLPFYDQSIYKITSSDINRLVCDFGGKLFFTYFPNKNLPQLRKRTTTVFFEIVYRTKEFSYGKNHWFGNVGFYVEINK